MARVKVYSSPGCPFCQLAKEFLKEKNIEFEEIDVSKDEKAVKELVEKTGQMGVPVIEIDGEIIIGFDKEKLEKALKLK